MIEIFKNIIFNIKGQYFFTKEKIFLLIIPSILAFIILPIYKYISGDIIFNVNTNTVENFIAIIAIVFGFLINFLILTKTDTNTFFTNYKKELSSCIKKCEGDINCIDECEDKYKFEVSFYSLFINKKYTIIYDKYIYDLIFFIIKISIIFPIVYFIFLYFASSYNADIVYILKLFFIYFVTFYLLNVLNLLSNLYILFFTNEK